MTPVIVVGGSGLGQSRLGIVYGLGAALLFAAATPLAKTLLITTPPLMLAALFYCGSGLGLFLIALWCKLVGASCAPFDLIEKSEVGWLLVAILAGGILAPAAMMRGLQLNGAASSSMLLNLEGVFTAAVAWIVFRENVDRRIFAGMVAILLGGLVLSVTGSITPSPSPGSLLIVLACLLWAADNNLCRKVATSGSVPVAMTKGLVAGCVNLAIAFSMGLPAPSPLVTVQALVIGFLCYGVSLVCYLTAQRKLGTARTGAYFAIAPFMGAFLSLVFLHEPVNSNLALAGALMSVGLWLHLTESHSHVHVHEAIEHAHLHSHDEGDPHHQHTHEVGVDVSKPHTHVHKHDRMVHEHAHYPDSHHNHIH